MLKKIAIALVLILTLIVALALTRPDSFTVERRIIVNAPPEKIMALVADFRNWQSWSPWEQLDPAMQRTFAGPASGKGAIYEWSGNSDVGRGRMEIIEFAPPSRAVIELAFKEPMAVTNMTTFAMHGANGSTEVVWTMSGPMPFVSKVMSVFMSMDTLIGRDFERGLVRLKTAAER
ncbi:SRPBCC family protein [Massilia sp. PAMC28688]|uniref:SRPBCC family protein n=1 Tax=Massilia sp. PAMC28688 TaxID=2861283 RepID=UPI001C6347A6|nr:SRPBCC family protein [Massilia sp. PAMC28688]QYF92447.1 SRPBCC family protein [Massilia sp. PAMC28688]